MSKTPRTDLMAERAPIGLRTNAAFEQSCDLCRTLERELNAANDRIKRLEEVTQERDKEWFQVIESILGFHPVSMTEALRIGIERIKKQKQRIKRLEEAGDTMANAYRQICYDAYDDQQVDNWFKAKEAKP